MTDAVTPDSAEERPDATRACSDTDASNADAPDAAADEPGAGTPNADAA